MRHWGLILFLLLAMSACGFDSQETQNQSSLNASLEIDHYQFSSIERFSFRNNYLAIKGATTADSKNIKDGVPCTDGSNPAQCNYLLQLPMSELEGQKCSQKYNKFRQNPNGLVFTIKSRSRCALISKASQAI